MATPFLLYEMNEQPALCERLLRGKPEQIARALGNGPPPRRVWFTGCGDMRFAAQAAAAYARRVLCLDARALPAMDLRYEHEQLGRDDLVVAASVSGRTPRTLEAAHLAARAGARVVLVTDDARAPIAALPGAVITLDTSPPEELSRHAYAGYARPVPQTKTFVAALLVEMLIARALAGHTGVAELAALPQVLAAQLERAALQLPGLVLQHLRDTTEVYVLASGPYVPLASYAAAKLLEYAVPAHAQCLEEFQHLEMFVTQAATGVLMLAADEASRARVLELTLAYDRLGCRTLVLGAPASYGGERTRQFALAADGLALELLALAIPLQRIAFELARVRGRDVDQWVGGERSELILAMSQDVVRGSRCWGL